MSTLNDKFDFWLEHNLNILLEGGHGIGKTAMIEACLARNNIKWKYFSAATMDPWVDFIGVPKEKTDERGSYLDLIRPREFRDDDVEVIVMDELNRAPPKVRNAIMELLQFKSINGRKFKNLRCVWAAVNPADEDDTYDVDRLDPAQQDRFEIQYSLPEVPNKIFFEEKFGIAGSRAIEWWESIPEEHLKLVSPRRLEYAVDQYRRGGELSDVLPQIVKPKMLKAIIERIDDEASHLDLWKADPDLYITRICTRGNKIDFVEAFKVLKTICIDQAVSYYDRLPANKKKQIIAEDATLDLAIRAPLNKSNTTALRSVVYEDIDPSMVMRDVTEHYSTLAPIMKTIAHDEMKMDDWKHLHQWISINPISRDHQHIATMIMAVCGAKVVKAKHSKPETTALGQKIMEIALTLFDRYPFFYNTIRVGAPLISKAIDCEANS